MASLTGNSIASTYTSLLKTTDNAAIGAGLKNITDGDGNETALSLGTRVTRLSGSAQVTGSLTVTGGGFTGSLNGTASWATYPLAINGTTLYSIIPQSQTTTPNTTDNIFLGGTAGDLATNAIRSVFIGYGPGQEATNASRSVFIGEGAGGYAFNAWNTVAIGFSAGYNGVESSAVGSIGSNNIILGTNISLSASRQDSINIGGIIYGTGSYSNTGDLTKPFSGSLNGRIGINAPTPIYNLDVSGSGNYTSGLTVSGSLLATGSLTMSGSVVVTGSITIGATGSLTFAATSSLVVPLTGSTTVTRGQMRFDFVTNKLWIYNGTVWVSASMGA